MLAVILMGSPADKPFVQRIAESLDVLGIPYEMRVASAHKTPAYLLELLERYEADSRPKVYITVAGRSNALSGLVDGHVLAPVIACPPYSEKFAGGDLLSSLRVPSGIAPGVALEPEGAALLAAKILAVCEPDLRRRVEDLQGRQRQRVLDADAALQE